MAKVAVVIPGYNVARILPRTVSEIPKGAADEIILVDDGSQDDTAEVGRRLGLYVVRHPRNRGYGGAQKTGYQEAVRRGAEIVVMVHGDDQYDPSLVPLFAAKIGDEGYDVVTGTRMVLGDVLREGMPIWKYIPNRFLTKLENLVFRTHLTDYHNGYRAYSARFLREIPLDLLSEYYDFDTDIMIQAAIRHYRVAELPNPTRYREENQQMSFARGVRYGLRILWTVTKYLLHKARIWRQPVFTGA